MFKPLLKIWAALVLVMASCAPVLADEGAEGVPIAKPPARPESQPEPVGELTLHQQQVAEKFRELEKLLLRMAELTAPSDPRRAALLRQAVAQSKERDIDQQFDTLLELLKQDRLAAVVKNQGDVRQDLGKLLELLLSEDRTKRIESEKQRVREYLKRVNKLIKEQKGIQGDTNRGADPRKLAGEQGDLADKAGELAKDLDDDPSKKSSEKENPAEDSPPGDKPQDKDKDKDKDKDAGKEQDKDQKGGEGKNSEPGKRDDEKSGKPDGEKTDKPDGEKSDKPSDEKSKPEKPSEKSPDKPQDGKESPGEDSQGKPPKGPAEKTPPGGEQPPGSDVAPPEEPSAQQDNPAKKRLDQAQQRMKEAQKKLEEAKREDATEKQAEAIKELEQAKADLEEILRQLREEEMARTLAMLEARFRKMLDQQVEVFEGTKRLDKVAEAERDRDDEIEAGRLSGKERQIVIEADKALDLLREEGSAVAFPEAVAEMRDDMQSVAERLSQAKVGEVTQGIEQDVIAALEEMVAALKKAQKDLDNKDKPNGEPGQGGDDQPPLVDTLSELKMIRALQMRVNVRTQRYAALSKTEQTDTPELLDALKKLAEREQRIHKVTRDIVVGRNR